MEPKDPDIDKVLAWVAWGVLAVVAAAESLDGRLVGCRAERTTDRRGREMSRKRDETPSDAEACDGRDGERDEERGAGHGPAAGKPGENKGAGSEGRSVSTERARDGGAAIEPSPGFRLEPPDDDLEEIMPAALGAIADCTKREPSAPSDRSGHPRHQPETSSGPRAQERLATRDFHAHHGPLDGKPLQKRGLDIGRLLQQVIHREAGYSEAFWRLDAPEGMFRVIGDPKQLAHAFSNLVLNALQAMDGRGTVEVSAAAVRLESGDDLGVEPGMYVRILVADRGCGFPPGAAPKLFEPFFTTKRDGTGLGLTVCRSIVELHGGAVALASRPGGGAEAAVYLPAEPDPTEPTKDPDPGKAR